MEIKDWLKKIGLDLKESEVEAAAAAAGGVESGSGSSTGGGVGGYWAFARNVSPGIQEYLEGLSFCHYLKTGLLLTPEEVKSEMIDPETGKAVSVKVFAFSSLGQPRKTEIG